MKHKPRRLRQVAAASIAHDTDTAPVSPGALSDITERQRADEALRESDQRFRILFDQATDGMMLADVATTRLTLANRQMQRQLAYSEDELLQLTVSDLHPAADLPAVLAQFRKLAHGETTLITDVPMRRKDGTVFYADISATVVRLQQRDCLFGIFRDITERRQADAELRASEERFRIAAETANDVVYEWDLHQSVKWLGNIDEILGYEPGEFPQTLDGWAASVHPEDLERTMTEVQAHLDHRTPYAAEYRVRRKDGTYRWWSARGAAARTPNGEPLRWIGSITDITERKRADEKLRETNGFLENLFNYANAPIIVWDPEFRITRFNHAFESLTGRSAEDVIGGPLDFLFPPDLVADSMALIRKTTGGERWETVDIAIRRLDGAIRTVLWNSATVFGADGATPVATIAQGQDITERKQAEEQLRENEERFRAMFDRSTVGRSLTSPDGKLLSVNAAFADILGLTIEELQQVDLASVTHPDDIAESRECIRSLLAKEHVSFRMEKRYRHKDGYDVWTDVSTTLLWDSQDKPLYFMASILDISKSKRAEEALRQSENRFRELSESLPQLIWTCRGDGSCDYLSPQWVEYTGIPEAEQLGFAWLERLHPSDRDRSAAAWQAAVDAHTSFDVEFRIRRHDGIYRWFQTRALAFRDDEGRIVKWFGSNTDIDDRRQAEAAVRTLNAELEQRVKNRTAQLEASNRDLEAFSYSVSHDLRAPLRAIDGFGRILKEDYESHLDAEGQRLLGVISSETQRMGHLIDDLLAFSRLGRQTMASSNIDMTALARAVFDEQAAQAPERVLRFELKPLPPGYGDRAMMRVALGNLLSNAIKFTRPRNPAMIEIGSRQQDGQVVYYVKDNGVGFDMRYAHKLFGVFQRLHPIVEFEGTGVGLALVQRIVHRHGGRVWAEGKVNDGAVFSFSLPDMKEAQR